MSEPEQRNEGILRQSILGAGTRRLPGFSSEMPRPASAAVSPERASSQLLTSLREQFAAELSALKDEARQQGMAAARTEADVALRVATDDLRKQWLQKESTLQRALEAERQHLAGAVLAVRAEHEKLVSGLEPVVARLALQVAARILGQHQLSRSLVADAAAQAIEAYRIGVPVQIRVSAADYEHARKLTSSPELMPCLLADHQVEPGSCLIDYGSGRLDASLEVQWQAVKLAVLAESPGDSRVADA